jgi:S-disulfanyl-L-cysteine oxidoreductase SoxD
MGRAMSRAFGACLLVATASAFAWHAQAPTTVHGSVARTVWDSVYSAVQATRGETAYVKACARCHRASLAGGDESPPLTGGGFLGNWNGLPLSDLQTRIRTTMPTDTVGIFDRQLVTDVIAYVLKVNGFPAGAVDLPPDTVALKEIVVQASRP